MTTTLNLSETDIRDLVAEALVARGHKLKAMRFHVEKNYTMGGQETGSHDITASVELEDKP